MLDIRAIRQNPDLLVKALEKRHAKVDLTEFLELDKQRRALISETEQMKNKQNEASKLIPAYKKEGKDISELMAEMKSISEKVKVLDNEIRDIDEKIEKILLMIPNMPNDLVPEGADDQDNEEIRRFGEPRQFDFEPKPHWELGADLDILDPETAAKVTGTRFTFYRGLGARLERAIANFMLDLHTDKHGYTEVFPPFMVNRASMTGTGQLPKFEDGAFKVAGTDYFLIPTAEVPVTNMHRDEILDGTKLPIKYCAYSACFRQEAGSAGRDTRGLVRQHQFNKV